MFAGGVVQPAIAQTDVVTLPKLEVTASSLLEREHWRYAQVPGFEILSQAPDATVARLVEELQAMPFVTRAIWPGPGGVRRPPTEVILCNADATFAGFIPLLVAQAVNPAYIDRLFFHTDTQEVIVLRCGPAGDPGRFKDLRRDYARRSLRALREPPPDWFVTGMAEIIADATYQAAGGKLKVQFAGLDEVPRGASAASAGGSDGSFDPASLNGSTLAPPSLYATEKPGAAVREIIRGALDNRSSADQQADDQAYVEHLVSHLQFNRYFFLHRSHSPFEDVLKNSPSLDPDEYRMTCWAFVHLCAFAQRRTYSAPLGRLLNLAGKNPAGDMLAMFRQAFGDTPHSMGVTVSEYCAAAGSSLGVTKEVPCPAFAVPAIAEADPMQIARLKADAFNRGGHPAEAEAEFTRARRLLHLPPATPPP